MLTQLRSKTMLFFIGSFLLPAHQILAADSLTHSCTQSGMTDTWTIPGSPAFAGHPDRDGYTRFGSECMDMLRHTSRFTSFQADWDEGWGWENACDARLPLSKTLRILELHSLTVVSSVDTNEKAELLDYLVRNEPYFSMLLVMADSYGFLERNINRIKTGCLVERYFFDARFDRPTKTITLFHRFFRPTVNVSTRAALLFHEAMHNLKSHNGGSMCPAKQSCDTEWNYGGAQTAHVLWSTSYAMIGANTTPFIRGAALDEAKVIADRFFVKNPNIVFPEVVPTLPAGW